MKTGVKPMTISRRALLGTATAAATLPMLRRARAADVVKLGVLTDMSGPYRDTAGPTSVACTRQAVQEFSAKGFTVEVVSADHQNKPDVGAGIARQWFDQNGVDVIVDVPNSGVALAVSGVAREKNKIFIDCGAGSSALTGASCSPNFIHWSYDTYMLGKSTGGATVKAGGDSWFFITADYAFGHQLQSDATQFITAAKGKVLGSATYPFPGTTDFSSFLLQAQSSKAKVLGLANAGDDTVNCIKQAKEFGLTSSGMQIAALLMFISDVNSLGLPVAEGLHLTESYYWDLNDRTRAFTKRVMSKTPDNMPNMGHAGCYSGALHFLKTVNDMGVAEAKKSGVATVNRMKAMPVEDDCFGKTSIRADGAHLTPAYLFEVKKPTESKAKWDYYKLVSTTPGAQAWPPLGDGGCTLGKA
jgi:branched-chain amino acid transport system substrate-binding protein